MKFNTLIKIIFILKIKQISVIHLVLVLAKAICFNNKFCGKVCFKLKFEYKINHYFKD